MTFNRVPHEPYATFTPIYSIGAILYIFAIEVIYGYEYAISYVISTTLNLLLTIVLVALLFYHIPFQHVRSNKWHAGYRFSHLWICTVLWIDALTTQFNLPLGDGKVFLIDYILIFGLFPSFFLGSWLMKKRYQTLQTLAEAVVSECKDVAEAELLRNEEEPEGQKVLDPRVYLPAPLRKYQESEVMLEQVGRLLWFDQKSQADVKAVETYYELCCLAFPESTYLQFLNAQAHVNLEIGNSYSNQEKLYEISCRKDITLIMRYSLFKESMESLQSSTKNNGKEESLDLVAYVEHQKNLLQAQKHYDSSLLAIRSFWYVSGTFSSHG